MAKAKPNLIMKGEQTFRHDLFKGTISEFKKNVSWQYGVVNIQSVPHIHFYHSYDSRGKKMTTTNSVGGHFHEVEMTMDAKGNLKAKCGPPLRKVKKRAGNRMKTKVERVKWYSEEHDREIVDNHSHDFEYVVSEEINVQRVSQQTNQHAERLMSEMTRKAYEDDTVKMDVVE